MSSYEKSNSKAHSNFRSLVPYQKENQMVGVAELAGSEQPAVASSLLHGQESKQHWKSRRLEFAVIKTNKTREASETPSPGRNRVFSMEKLSSKVGPFGPKAFGRFQSPRANCVPDILTKRTTQGGKPAYI